MERLRERRGREPSPRVHVSFRCVSSSSSKTCLSAKAGRPPCFHATHSVRSSAVFFFFFLVSFFFYLQTPHLPRSSSCVLDSSSKETENTKKSKRRQECQLRVSAPSAHKAPKINTSLPLFIFKHILCTRCEESTARRRYLVTYPKTASTRQTNLGLLFS